MIYGASPIQWALAIAILALAFSSCIAIIVFMLAFVVRLRDESEEEITLTDNEDSAPHASTDYDPKMLMKRLTQLERQKFAPTNMQSRDPNSLPRIGRKHVVSQEIHDKHNQ